MRIDIHSASFPLTDALRRHAERRLRSGLAFCDERVQRVAVRLSDVNGPRGGADKSCQVQVVLPRLQDVVIENTEHDLYAAIDRAAERAGRAVGRRLTRRRDRFRTCVRPEADASGTAPKHHAPEF